MNDMTEEQQAERLRQWWRENGRSVIIGLAIGVGGILGWQGWTAHQRQVAEAGSMAYDRFLQLADDDAAAYTQGERLIQEHGDTPYAALTALNLAKRHAEDGDLEQARARLNWVIKHADQKGLPELARLRLAGVLIALGRADEALTQLTPVPKGMEILYEETRGDALKAQGDTGAAASAYDQALERLSPDSRRRLLIQAKRDDLGVD